MPYTSKPRQGQGAGRGQPPQTQIIYHQQQQPLRQQPQRDQREPLPSQGNYNTQPQQQRQDQPPIAPAPSKLEPPPIPPTPPTITMDTDPEDMPKDGAGDESRPKWMRKRKDSGVNKISKKVKRKRQNARLRKMLQPKNAIMVLNELKAGVKFSFQEQINALQQTVYIVSVEVDDKVFTGQGLSKAIAKQNAAENALKALLIDQMGNAPKDEPMEAVQVEDAETNGESQDGKPKRPPPEDDMPWGSLASFALYKLFSDWQSQGTHVPITKQASPNTSIEVRSPAPMKKVPDNPTERHPVMLLNQLRPGVQFTEVSTDGVAPNVTFTMGVKIDDDTYTGVGKNKKEAKKEAAKAALSAAFEINYE